MRTFCSLALVGLFFTVPSVVRAQQGPEGNGKDDIKILKKDLEDARRLLDLANLRIQQLDEQVNTLKATLALANEVRAKMAELDKSLAKLQQGVTSSESFKKAYTSTTPLATVSLVNHSREQLTFYINDTPYVVPGQMSMLVNGVPPGRFSYKVIHSAYGVLLSSNPTETLAPGQTYTLSAR